MGSPTRIGALLAFVATPVMAQSINGAFLDSEIPFDISRGHNVSVREREHPEYDPLGLRAGGFIVHPQVRVGVGFTDNVFAVKNDAIKDGFGVIEPNLAAQSDWSRHAVGADVGMALRRFFDQSIKDENSAHAGLNGRLDAGDTSISAGARILRAYELQYSATFINNALEPVQYVGRSANVRATYRGGSVIATASADINRLKFRDNRAFDGTLIDQASRDRQVKRVSGRLEYDATDANAAFVQYTYSTSRYDESRGLGGVANRDSNENRILGVVTFDLSQLVRGAFGAGYVDRKYQSAAYGSIKGLALDIRIDWFVTQLTTVSAAVKRQVEDSVIPGSGGYFATAAIARIDHELLRNLLLSLEAGYERDKFVGIDQRNRVWRFSGGADASFNRWLSANVALQHIDRVSNDQITGQSFKENRATVSLLFRI